MQTVSTSTLGEQMLYRGMPVLDYRIEYPVFSSSCSRKAARLINRYYKSFAKGRENYCRTVLYLQAVRDARYIPRDQEELPFRPYEFIMTYKVTYNQGCTVSLYMEEYTYLGGAHGSTVRNADTWDFDAGTRIRLKDLYGGKLFLKKRITGEIKDQIVERLKEEPGAFFSDYEKGVAAAFSPEHFFVTPEGIVVFFQEYEIAPYVAGIPEFLLENTGAPPG